MTQLARRHNLTAAMLVDEEFDVEECRKAMQAYCGEVVMVPNPRGQEGAAKRLLQVRSLASVRSFERLRFTLPALQRSLDQILHAKRFYVVNLEFPYLGHYELRKAPPGKKPPALVVDFMRSPTTWRGSSPAPAEAWAAASMPAPIGASSGGRN